MNCFQTKGTVEGKEELTVSSNLIKEERLVRDEWFPNKRYS